MTAPTRPCPFCHKIVLLDEPTCWSCGRELPPAEPAPKQEQVIELLSNLAKRRMDNIVDYRLRAENERRQRQLGGVFGTLRNALAPTRYPSEGEEAWVEQRMRADPEVLGRLEQLKALGVDAAPLVTGKKLSGDSTPNSGSSDETPQPGVSIL